MLETIYVFGVVATFFITLGLVLRRYSEVSSKNRRPSQLVYGLVGVVVASAMWPIVLIVMLTVGIEHVERWFDRRSEDKKSTTKS